MKKSFKFSRALRLCKKKDFQFVYKTGRSFVEYAGIFYVLKKDNSISSKLGVAAGKKLGNAVVRNRMKRLMREVYRNLQFDIEKGFEIIWIARRPLLNANIDFYKKTFLKFAKRAGILAKKEG